MLGLQIHRPREQFYWTIILILIISLGPVFVHATGDPNNNLVITPSLPGPCTWFVYMSGTQPIAHAMVSGLSVSPGDNVVGIVGQDPSAFVSSNVLSANEEVCLSGQTFTFASTLQITQPRVSFVGMGPSTVITQGNALNLGSLVYVAGQNSYIADMTFDGNRLQQTGPTASGCLRFSTGSDGGKARNLYLKHCWDNGIYICASAGVATCSSPITSSVPRFLSFTLVNGTDNGKGSGGGSTFDNGSGSYVTLTGYTSSSDQVGLISTDIGAGASTIGSSLAINGSIAKGIYNGCNALLSSLLVTSSGTYGIFLDGGCSSTSITNFDLAGSTSADVNIASLTPSLPYIVSNGFVRSTTKVAGSLDASHVIFSLVQGYNPQAPSLVTAGASIWTYTNNDPYFEAMQLATVAGISAWTCNGTTGWAITAGSFCYLGPSKTMVVTWSTTAPVFQKNPT